MVSADRHLSCQSTASSARPPPPHLMSTKPPSSEGPTLSAWYPLTDASAASPAVMSSTLESGLPKMPFTAHAAAAALAALEPSPEPRGRPCSTG